MKNILVPTDFSPVARNAAMYAVNLAKALHYQITLFHVYNVPVVSTPDVQVIGINDAQNAMIDLHDLEREQQERLKQEVDVLCKDDLVAITCKTAIGFVVDEIISFEKNHPTDLIVLGLDPTGTFSDFIFGNTATDVIKRTETPVIVVPGGLAFKPIQEIVFASDLKMESGMKMHEPLNDLICSFSSKISILNVVKEQADRIGKDDGVSGRRIETYFENKEHIYHFLENNDIVQGINEFITTHHIDMVTMIPQKHNLIERLFKESNTKKIAFQVDIPLLTLPLTGSSEE